MLDVLVRLTVGPGLLVTKFGRDVPSTVRNTPVRAAGEVGALHAIRTLMFASGQQLFVDLLLLGAAQGDDSHTLRNVVGRASRVEMELLCGVTDDRGSHLTSRRAWIRIARLRMPLPRLLTVQVNAFDGYDGATRRQTVSAAVRTRCLGSCSSTGVVFCTRFE